MDKKLQLKKLWKVEQLKCSVKKERFLICE